MRLLHLPHRPVARLLSRRPSHCCAERAPASSSTTPSPESPATSPPPPCREPPPLPGAHERCRPRQSLLLAGRDEADVGCRVGVAEPAPLSPHVQRPQSTPPNSVMRIGWELHGHHPGVPKLRQPRTVVITHDQVLSL
eukprot:XP_001700209.1 predicted protein [Chlamydomonas reinhardtii]